MISRWPSLTLLIVVFAPGVVYAQPTDPSSQSASARRDLTISEKGTINVDKMYEDIEVLRRILDRKLMPLYPSIPSKAARTDLSSLATFSGPTDRSAEAELVTPGSAYQIEGQKMRDVQSGIWYETRIPYPATIPFPSLEGIYLLGHGVIYTATLSSLQPSAKVQADSSDKVIYEAVLRESEWDSIRRQVRNEKEKPKKPEESKPPSLSDVLLKLLAENGHNFSQLDGNESVTLVLTVHETGSSSGATKSGTGSAKADNTAAPTTGVPLDRSQLRHLELLGELHLKQGKYDEAIRVYARMLGETKSPKVDAELNRKLAQCYLMQGQDEQARAFLDQAIALMKKETEAKDKPLPAAKPAAALPVKLIVSAPKKLLDQVKAGKITFEEFRRQASVETLRFGDRR